MIKVGFTYPGAPKKALSAITLHVRLSSRVAVVGANGAGKSTLIKVWGGVERCREDGLGVRHVGRCGGEWHRLQPVSCPGRHPKHSVCLAVHSVTQSVSVLPTLQILTAELKPQEGKVDRHPIYPVRLLSHLFPCPCLQILAAELKPQEGKVDRHPIYPVRLLSHLFPCPCLQILTAELKPQEGKVDRHPNLRVAYVAQHAFHHLEEHLDISPNRQVWASVAEGVRLGGAIACEPGC